MNYQDEEICKQFDEDCKHKEMPWLRNTMMDYVPENGYKFIEFDNVLDKRLNEKVSEKDYENGMRYLKVRVLNNLTVEEYNKLCELYVYGENHRFTRVLESDVLTFDLTQKEQKRGYCYLKVFVPTGKLSKGWLTYSEIEDDWKISLRDCVRKHMLTNKKRKVRRQKRQRKMMDEVKKYISLQ